MLAKATTQISFPSLRSAEKRPTKEKGLHRARRGSRFLRRSPPASPRGRNTLEPMSALHPSVVVVAAGSGTRLRSAEPKAFRQRWLGRRLLWHAWRASFAAV